MSEDESQPRSRGSHALVRLGMKPCPSFQTTRSSHGFRAQLKEEFGRKLWWFLKKNRLWEDVGDMEIWVEMNKEFNNGGLMAEGRD